MRTVFLPIALVAVLAACEQDGRGGGGLFGGSSRDMPVYSSGSSSGVALTAAERRAIERACDPRNVPSDRRASVLHQDRPGGSTCADNVLKDMREGRDTYRR